MTREPIENIRLSPEAEIVLTEMRAMRGELAALRSEHAALKAHVQRLSALGEYIATALEAERTQAQVRHAEPRVLAQCARERRSGWRRWWPWLQGAP